MQRKHLLAIFLLILVFVALFYVKNSTVTSQDDNFAISVGGEVKLYDPNGNLVSKRELVMLALMNHSQEIDSMAAGVWWQCGGRDIDWLTLKVGVEVRLTVIYNTLLYGGVRTLINNELQDNVTSQNKNGEHSITLESLDNIIAPYINDFVNNSYVTFKLIFKISASAFDVYGYQRTAKPIKIVAVATLKWVEPYIGVEGDVVTDPSAQTYEAGYSDGYNDGYNEGYDDGYRGAPYDDTVPSVSGSDEYVQGYEAGYKDGYDEGYWDGYYAAQQPGTGQIASIIVLSATSTAVNGDNSSLIVIGIMAIIALFFWLQRKKR